MNCAKPSLGYVLVKSPGLPLRVGGGVCGRTQQVRDAIVAAIEGVSSCLDVTGVHLAGITELDLSVTDTQDESEAIALLLAGDFAGLSALTSLNLAGNSLSSLPEGVFAGLSALTSLNLAGNSLSSLPEGVFAGLSALTELDLAGNSLSSLPEGVFAGLSALAELDLAGNSLNSLPEGVFAGLSALTELDLAGNSLNSLPEGVFAGLSSLLTLGLNDNGFTTVPSGVFSDTPALVSLYLTGNQIATLDAGAFTGLEKLEHLFLSQNQLTELPSGVFAGLTSLARLELNDNPKDSPADLEVRVSLARDGDDGFKVTVPTGAPFNIVAPLTVAGGSIDGGATTATIPVGAVESATFRVDGGAVVSLGELPARPSQDKGYVLVKSPDLTLSLGGICGRTQQVRDAIVAKINGVSDCAYVTDAHLEGITELDLSVNPVHDASQAMRTLQAGDFAGLSALTDLDLEGNSLNSLPEGIFAGLSALTHLDLDFGFFTGIPSNAFTGLSALTHLELGKGSGQVITIPANAFSELTSLHTLNLDQHPNLTEVSPGAFTGLSSLINLSLGGNSRLTTLNPGMLSGLSSLQNLGLVSNAFTTVPSGVFSDTPELRRLNLERNQIATLDAGAFAGLGRLGGLYLDENQLTELPDGVFAGLTSLGILYLDKNPRGDPVDLEVTVSLVRTTRDATADEYQVKVPTGAPFHMVVPFDVSCGNVVGDATSFIIREGEVESAALRFNHESSDCAVSVSIGGLPPLPSGVAGHKGYVLVEGNPPVVTRTPSDTDMAPALDVAWTAPDGVAVTGYEAQYRSQGSAEWTAYTGSFRESEAAFTLPDLQPGATYEVQVRALSADGPGDWSETGTGRANRPPHGKAWSYGSGDIPVGVRYQDRSPRTRYFGDADGDTLSFFESSDNDALVASWVGHDGHSFNFLAHNPGRSTITYGMRDGYGGKVTRTVVYTGQRNEVRWVAEPPPGFRVYLGSPVVGNPTRHNYPITPYTLNGEAAATFDIDPSTGQITLKQGHTLDYESKHTYTGGVEYTVNGGAAAVGLTIKLSDTPAPLRPAPPTVTTVEGYAAALNLAWRAPNSHGWPITDYNLRYRQRGAADWIEHPFDGVGVSTVLTGLANTNYEAQVQAVSAEGSSPWSDSGYIGAPAPPPGVGTGPDTGPDTDDTGPDTDPNTDPEAPRIESPGQANTAPYFSGPETRYVDESAAAGTAVGDPVTATDAENDVLAYSISGAGEFTIDANTGQVRVAAGPQLDRDATASYTVTVGVSDGKDATGAVDTAVDDTVTVSIRVTNAENPRPALSLTLAGPEGPRLTADPFDVTVTFSEEPGRYDLASANLRTPLNAQQSGTTVTFSDVQPDYDGSRWGTWPYQSVIVIHWRGITERYQVSVDPDPPQVLRLSGPAGTQRDAFTVDIQLTEDVEGFTADDLTVVNGEARALRKTGQWTWEADIRPTAEGTLTVDIAAGAFQDVSGHDNTAAQRYSAMVDLAPSMPGAPRMLQSPIDPTTMLDVIWAAPRIVDGPPTDYDVQYRATGAAEWSNHDYNGASTITTLGSLADGTTYRAQVRARNAHGASEWSESGQGDTQKIQSMRQTVRPASCDPSANVPGGDTAPTLWRSISDMRLRSNISFHETFPSAVPGSGSGGPYTYALCLVDGYDRRSIGKVPGVEFSGMALKGVFLTLNDVSPYYPPCGKAAPCVYHLEYVVQDVDGNRAVFPFDLTVSGQWSNVFIAPKYPWVAKGENAAFSVIGQYSFNAPTVKLKITTTGAQGVQTRYDTVHIPVTPTESVCLEHIFSPTDAERRKAAITAAEHEDDCVYYEVPTTGVDTVTVALVPQNDYIIASRTSWLNTAKVKVVEEVIRPTATADAGGPNVQVPPGGEIVLRGSYSFAPPYEAGTAEFIFYDWVQLSGPAATIKKEGFTNLSVDIPRNISLGEILEFQLTVGGSPWGATDRDTGTDTVRVEVVAATGGRGSGGPAPEPPQAPVAPTANAGPDLTGAPGESVTLQGTNSENPNGEASQLAHSWTQLSGPSVTLSDATVGDSAFPLPEDAGDGVTLEFELTVTDEHGQSDADKVTVTVRIPPTANAGPDQAAPPGANLTLQGIRSVNPYGKWWHLEYRWTQLSGPAVTVSDLAEPEPTFTIPSDAADGTTLEFQLTVTNRYGQTDSDTVTFTVDSSATLQPAACAGPDLTGAPGESVTLEGTCSENPYGRWWKLEHSWSQLSGPPVTLDQPTHGNPTFTLPDDAADGTALEFQLTVTDKHGRSDSDTVTVTVAAAAPEPEPNRDPTFNEGDSTTRTVAENSDGGVNVGAPVAASDPEDNALAYALSGADADSFEIDGNTGQLLTKAGVTYDYESQPTYSVNVTADDGNGGAASIAVTVSLTNANDPPVFDAGPSASRSLAENTGAGENVGLPLAATDQDGDPLTYSLSGDDAGSFEIDSDTGQLLTREGASYDYEEKATYSVTVEVSDGNESTATIAVTVNLTDVEEAVPNNAPVFDEGDSATRSLAENSGAGINVGLPLTATDLDGDPLTYTLSGDDAGSFEIDSDTGQLLTVADVTYDYGEKATYSVTVEVSDGAEGTATIAVTVNLTEVDESEGQDGNSDPVFDEGERATRSLAEDSAAGENVGLPLTATDPDDDTLTYTLSGDGAESFDINSATGQLTTKEGVSYDYETKSTYAVTVTAEDPEGASASIGVTVSLTDANDPPVFDEGTGASRSLAENTGAGENVGLPLAATDQDGDTLTYSLSGDDAADFELDTATGQLLTREGASYDYEEKATYSVTVEVSDGNEGTATIAVTVNLTDVEEAAPNNAPVFDEGDSAIRSLAENSPAGENVGAPVTATDQDDDILTYRLSGADAGSFDIDSTTGQLTTKEGVSYDYEAKQTYSVAVTAEDPEGSSASIGVTVSLTDVEEAAAATACFTNLNELKASARFQSAWDDPDCRAHHRDSLARYFHFTLTEETEVSITLTPESGGTLFVSKDTPKNGWGTPPNSDYETRRMVRRGNGKLVHDGAHTGSNRVTLTLAAGEYTAEAAGSGGTFTLSIGPQ